MPPQVIDDLVAEVTNTTGVEDSAIAFINGEAARLQAAVDKALAGGATAEQLAPIRDEIALLVAKREALAAALAANPV